MGFAGCNSLTGTKVEMSVQLHSRVPACDLERPCTVYSINLPARLLCTQESPIATWTKIDKILLRGVNLDLDMNLM